MGDCSRRIGGGTCGGASEESRVRVAAPAHFPFRLAGQSALTLAGHSVLSFQLEVQVHCQVPGPSYSQRSSESQLETAWQASPPNRSGWHPSPSNWQSSYYLVGERMPVIQVDSESVTGSQRNDSP